jgi:hypothetical protein
MLFLHAPDESSAALYPRLLIAFCPWLLIFGTWFAAWWLAWRAERWLVACSVVAALLGIFIYGWLTLELP